MVAAWPFPRIVARRSVSASGVFVAVLVLVALFAPLLTPVSPTKISTESLQPPFGRYVLGTDELGRSVAVQLLFGLRVSLLVGLLSAFVATALGIAVGSVAGYFGHWLDVVLMRITEIFQVTPSFILAALIVALLGAGLSRVIAVIAILSWPEAARVMRSEVLRIRELEYVDAARSLGIGEWRVMVGEVVPNALGPVAAVGTLIIGRAILLEASLSFLGLSSADVPSWGRMLNSGQRFLFEAWWLSVFPGLAIFITVLLFNIFGDGVARALDPRRAARDEGSTAGEITSGSEAERAHQASPGRSPGPGGPSDLLLEVEDLRVSYKTPLGTVDAVRGASLTVRDGESVGLVGESGCGKSTLVRALVGLLPPRNSRIRGGRISIAGRDVTHADEREWQRVRGNPIAMVFQDSLSFLNPIMRISTQIAEAVQLHDPSADVRGRLDELADLVKLPRSVLRAYPFELSGGMRQRVCIAVALGCRPRLLVADEPTTALDVTTQAEILALINELRRSQRMALLLISHDLGVVRELCDHAFVMYAGTMIEWGETGELFARPQHPYVTGLLSAARTVIRSDGRFATIEGEVPDLRNQLPGCPFAPRCPQRMEVCDTAMPPAFPSTEGGGHQARCWLMAPDEALAHTTQDSPVG